MSHEDDAIVPGERIGPFRLGAGESEVLAFLAREGGVQREQREGTQVVHAGDLSFWFDDGRLTQVGAHSRFGGKLAERVGVGSTLDELAELGEHLLCAEQPPLATAGHTAPLAAHW